MKYLIFLFLLSFSYFAQAQRYSFPVKELDSTNTCSSVFHHQPIRLEIEILQTHVIGITDTTQRYVLCNVITTYKENVVAPYQDKRTQTFSIIKVPLSGDVINAFFSNAAVNELHLNKVIEPFGLIVDHNALIKELQPQL